MTISAFTAYTPIPERSDATPGLFNRPLQQLQDNIQSLYSNVSTYLNNPISGNTIQAESGSTVRVLGDLIARSIDSGGEVFNILAFGASTAASAAANTVALQAAADATVAARGTIFVPHGVFDYSGFTITGRFRLTGAGADSMLRNTATNGATGIAVKSPSTTSTIDGWYVGNLTLSGESGSGDQLRLHCCHRGLMENVVVPSSGSGGVVLDGSLLNTLNSVHVTTNHPYTAGTRKAPTHGFVAQSGSTGACAGNGANANVFMGCTAEGVTSGDGIGYLLLADANIILGGASEGNVHGVRLGTGVHNNVIWTYMESNTSSDITHVDATLGKNIVLPAPGPGDGLAKFNLLYHGDGSQPLPGLAFRDDPTLGMTRRGVGLFDFVYANARLLSVSSTVVETYKSIVPDSTATRDLGSSSLRFNNVFSGGYYEGAEITDPAAPADSVGRLYFKSAGGGLTALVAIFPNGSIITIATEA